MVYLSQNIDLNTFRIMNESLSGIEPYFQLSCSQSRLDIVNWINRNVDMESVRYIYKNGITAGLLVTFRVSNNHKLYELIKSKINTEDYAETEYLKNFRGTKYTK